MSVRRIEKSTPSLDRKTLIEEMITNVVKIRMTKIEQGRLIKELN